MIGPAPDWARADGGEAGLHPSNLHDNAYAVGSIDFTGDMPILLGPDGPSLGGFVCPAVVASDDLWKIGQQAARRWKAQCRAPCGNSWRGPAPAFRRATRLPLLNR